MEAAKRSHLDIFDKFKSPDLEFYPAVYWFWHHIPNKEEIETQLEHIYESGFKTFLIQARLALPIEKFLSEEYLDAYLYAMEVAKRLGLIGGLYDDYNWQSGHGGGLTVRGSDNIKERHLFWSSAQVNDKELLCYLSGIDSLMVEGLGEVGLNWCYEGGVIKWGEWKIFKALAYPDISNLTIDRVIDISDYCKLEETSSDGIVVRILLPQLFNSGWKVTTFVSGKCLTSRAINYLQREATLKFIEVAYEPFAKRLREYLGNQLSFTFFDHPHAGLYSWDQHEGNVLNSLMFDERLVSEFIDEHGYPIEWALLSFIHPLGNLTSKYRCDFFDTYSRLGCENFFGQIAEWTQSHNLGLAGHEVLSYIGKWGFVGGFEKVDNRTIFGSDYFAVDRYRTLTTVDAFNNLPQISAKMGDSLAKANGRRGCLVEQYYVSPDEEKPWAVGQWDLTLDAYRSQAIRHHLLGARQFLYHGFYLSDGEAGDFTLFKNPRFDFAPGINYEPWIPFHSDFALEMARLSTFINSGDPQTNIAVLYPLRTFWAEGAQHSFAQESEFWNKWLVEQGFNFDFIDESQINSSSILENHFHTDYRKYEALILPGISTLQSENTIGKILSFADKNGIVIASGQFPTATQESGFDPSIEKRFREMFAKSENTIFFSNTSNPIEVHDKLNELLPSWEKKSFKLNFLNNSHENVWSWFGTHLLDTLVVLFNDSMEKKQLSFSIPDQSILPERWDPLLGKRMSWAWFKRDSSSTTIHLLLDPKELTCLRLKSTDKLHVPYLLDTSFPPSHASHLEGNLYTVFDCEQGNQEIKAIISSQEEPVIANEITKHEICLIEKNIWQIDIQTPSLPEPIHLEKDWYFHPEGSLSKREIDINLGWEEQGYADYSGKGYYECEFNITKEYLDCDVDLVFMQLETAAEIYINRELIGKRGWPPYRFSIPKSKISPGKNHLKIQVYNTGGNRYYQNTPYAGRKPTPSGIIGPPCIKPLNRIIVTSKNHRSKSSWQKNI